MNHTPGPWTILHYTKGTEPPIPFLEFRTTTVFAPNGKGGLRGDVAYMQHGLWGDDQAEANARLIAAAPELLDVLKELQESAAYWSEYDVPLGIVDRIRAAIAKATGGSHE